MENDALESTSSGISAQTAPIKALDSKYAEVSRSSTSRYYFLKDLDKQAAKMEGAVESLLFSYDEVAKESDEKGESGNELVTLDTSKKDGLASGLTFS